MPAFHYYRLFGNGSRTSSATVQVHAYPPVAETLLIEFIASPFLAIFTSLRHWRALCRQHIQQSQLGRHLPMN